MTTSQETVYNTLKEYGPLPDHALVPLVQHVAQSKMSSSGIRSRRAELAASREVVKVDEIKMPSGRKAAVWDIA